MPVNQKYINRELSWLQFNQRVLHEVLDQERDPISRLFFSAIFSNNLDEFFMVRVGGLNEQIRSNYKQRDIADMTPSEQLEKIRVKVQELVSLQYAITKHVLEGDLKNYGVNIVKMSDLNDAELSFVEDYFEEHIYPVLTPMAIDMNRPFPLVQNKSLNILFKFKAKEDRYATVQVPSVLSRTLAIDESGRKMVLLEDVIMYYSSSFFEGFAIEAKGLYRPTRNADISLNQEVAEDLLEAVGESLRLRKRGEVIRLEIEREMPVELVNYLVAKFECSNESVYLIDAIIDLTFLFSLGDFRRAEDIFRIAPIAMTHPDKTLFEAIEQEDFLLHHPFESFDPVVELVNRASLDPDVLAIKQVLYRVSGDSPIVKALARAASRGKQVTVVLELMARFDEENNINWARQLEKNGCHVIFGLQGMKTHAKITLIVRREAGYIKRYVHVSSGNYNDKTAKLYTDIGMMTCDEQIASDASKFFNMLSGYTKQSELKELIAAPDVMKDEILNMIEREIHWAKQGIKAKIIIKCNAIVDKDVIDALYLASQAAVEVILIIRGISCLIPGIDGLSENISLISIVDDLLEHSRIYYFSNNGKDDIFIASADCMPRNLVRRVELMTPVKQRRLKDELLEILDIYMTHKKKARYLNSNGYYTTAISDDDMSAQKALMNFYRSRSAKQR